MGAQGAAAENFLVVRWAQVDWLHAAGVDYITTESGFSEFTHPADTVMLALMNELADYAADTYTGMRTYIKCHCSAGQKCTTFTDPRTPPLAHGLDAV